MRIVQSVICVLILSASLFTASAQTVRTVTFRIPVEIDDIRFLSSVRADCKIQDGTRDGPLNIPNWSNRHTITKRVSVFIMDDRFPACSADPRSDDAAYRCADVSPEGKSWSNIIEVPIRDFESGGIRVADGQVYRCLIDVAYDTEPERAGEAALSDGLCAGFYENPYAITARERYQTYTGGDIADANLCIRTEFDASLDVVNVPTQFIRGGERIPPAEDTPPETTSPPPVVQVPLPQTKSKLPPSVTAPALSLQTSASTCADAVQGKIAWDYNGNKTWGAANLNRLCAGAEDSTEPARCFEKVMHGGVNWGGSTQWQWANALNLCAGTRDANATVACFETAIGSGKGWSSAIDQCKASP